MADKEAEVSDVHYTLYQMVRSIHKLKVYLGTKPTSAQQKAQFADKVTDSLLELYEGHKFLEKRLPLLHDEFSCALPTIATMGRLHDTSYHELTYGYLVEIVFMFHGAVVGFDKIRFNDLFKARKRLLSLVVKHFVSARTLLIADDDFEFDFDYLQTHLVKEYDFALERLRRSGGSKPLSEHQKKSQDEMTRLVKDEIRKVLSQLGRDATSREIREKLGRVGSEGRFWDALKELERDGEWAGRQRRRH